MKLLSSFETSIHNTEYLNTIFISMSKYQLICMKQDPVWTICEKFFILNVLNLRELLQFYVYKYIRIFSDCNKIMIVCKNIIIYYCTQYHKTQK